MRVALLVCVLTMSAAAGPILPDYRPNGDVRWGPGGDKAAATDAVAPGQSIFFEWTEKGKTHDGYAPFSSNTPNLYRFIIPPDRTITDWNQIIKKGSGESAVRAGNIERKSPWDFYPLADLDLPPVWRIPDFAPRDVAQTIYTAVDLKLYYASNPLGPLGGIYQRDQTLDELGLTIVNGVIPGLLGIYFATTEFELDPDSDTGWVPVGGSAALLNSNDYQAQNGPVALISIHEGVPEPSSWVLLGSALAGLVVIRHRGSSEARKGRSLRP
jgi:hypothetical protein